MADLLQARASARRCKSENKPRSGTSGYDQLLNPAIDLFNDAVFEPKMVVVPIILSSQELLNNQGEAQLLDVFDSYISAAEKSLSDTMDAGIYSDGTANGNKADHRLGDRHSDHDHERRLRRHRPRHGGDLADGDVRRFRRCRQRVAVGNRHAGHVGDDPADAQLRHDAAVAGPRLRRSR